MLIQHIFPIFIISAYLCLYILGGFLLDKTCSCTLIFYPVWQPLSFNWNVTFNLFIYMVALISVVLPFSPLFFISWNGFVPTSLYYLCLSHWSCFLSPLPQSSLIPKTVWNPALCESVFLVVNGNVYQATSTHWHICKTNFLSFFWEYMYDFCNITSFSIVLISDL